MTDEQQLVAAIHKVVALDVRETLKYAAPGLAEPARNAIATNLAIKLSRKVAALALKRDM